MTNEERDKTVKILQWLHDNNFLFRSTEEDVKYATKLAIQELQQEPFMNKHCVARQVCHEDEVKMLDKIRSEIEQLAKDYDKFADYRRIYGLWIALDIIDKYRAEKESE